MVRLESRLVVALLMTMATTAFSITLTWTGAANDHLWSNGANWDKLTVVPGTADDVVIPPNAFIYLSSVNVSVHSISTGCFSPLSYVTLSSAVDNQFVALSVSAFSITYSTLCNSSTSSTITCSCGVRLQAIQLLVTTSLVIGGTENTSIALPFYENEYAILLDDAPGIAPLLFSSISTASTCTAVISTNMVGKYVFRATNASSSPLVGSLIVGGSLSLTGRYISLSFYVNFVLSVGATATVGMVGVTMFQLVQLSGLSEVQILSTGSINIVNGGALPPPLFSILSFVSFTTSYNYVCSGCSTYPQFVKPTTPTAYAWTFNASSPITSSCNGAAELGESGQSYPILQCAAQLYGNAAGVYTPLHDFDSALCLNTNKALPVLCVGMPSVGGNSSAMACHNVATSFKATTLPVVITQVLKTAASSSISNSTNNLSMACLNCPPHYYCSVNSSSSSSFDPPQLCPGGSYCPQGVAHPIVCPTGYACSTGSDHPQVCGSDYSYSNYICPTSGIDVATQICPPATFSNGTSCLPCAQFFYIVSLHNREPTSCSSGFDPCPLACSFYDTTSLTCQSCSNGLWNTVTSGCASNNEAFSTTGCTRPFEYTVNDTAHQGQILSCYDNNNKVAAASKIQVANSPASFGLSNATLYVCIAIHVEVEIVIGLAGVVIVMALMAVYHFVFVYKVTMTQLGFGGVWTIAMMFVDGVSRIVDLYYFYTADFASETIEKAYFAFLLAPCVMIAFALLRTPHAEEFFKRLLNFILLPLEIVGRVSFCFKENDMLEKCLLYVVYLLVKAIFVVPAMLVLFILCLLLTFVLLCLIPVVVAEAFPLALLIFSCRQQLSAEDIKYEQKGSAPSVAQLNFLMLGTLPRIIIQVMNALQLNVLTLVVIVGFAKSGYCLVRGLYEAMYNCCFGGGGERRYRQSVLEMTGSNIWNTK